MKRLGPAILLVLFASLMAHAAPVKPDTNYDVTGWRSVEKFPNRIVVSGGAPLLTSGDGKLRVSADRMVLTLAGKDKGRQTVSIAEVVGSVKIHAVPGPEQQVDAACQKAVIHPSTQMADLAGSVKVKMIDRTKFSGAVELSGDTVTLNLKNGLVVATSRRSQGRLRTSAPSGKGR
jgi:lipopolysaccharide export system protein LptA